NVPPLDGESSQYPQRYASSEFRFRRRGVGIGAAWRPLDWLAVGASVFAFDVRLQERRLMWAGTPTDTPYDPTLDTAFMTDGHDWFVPAGSLGIILAPDNIPLELGVSAFLSDDAHISGTPTVLASRGTIPEGAIDAGNPYATAQTASDAKAAV